MLLALIAAATVGFSGPGDIARFVGEVLLLGPIIGFLIGGACSSAMAWVDGRTPVRREYQAMFGLGVVVLTYASATAAGGGGFLAAFAAGVAVVLLDKELCDCFLEYGGTTAEMLMQAVGPARYDRGVSINCP